LTVTLYFHGAAGTVTGSCYRVVHDKGQFLVDCGMFQGNKTVRDLNYKPFPFAPKSLDYVLLTHAHIDHVGLLPKLAKNGYRQPIWMTEPTSGLLEYLLPDSAGIQESEAERETKKRTRRDEPAFQPLYTMEDAEAILKLRQTLRYEEWVSPGPGVRVRYWNAGHILGSASIEVEVEDRGKPIRILFSGDLGPDQKVFYDAPDAPSGYDYIISESTYGGRDRQDMTLVERREALKAEVNSALARGGNLVIPTFAVERSQELLHDLGVLIRSGEINPQLVFLDSPLASKVTAVYRKYASMFDDMELSADELFNDSRFRIIEGVDESKAINQIRSGAIIMSASGMAEAGRIKHHLRTNLPRSNATVLFVGYQAPGTLGQIIQSGAREVRIHSEIVPVRAQIRSLGNYSAHADHSELVTWVTKRLPAHGAVFLTHGEDEERNALRDALMREAGLGGDQVILPLLDDQVELRSEGIASVERPAARRVDLAQVASDWHNAYASFIIDLSHQLQAASTDTERIRVMSRLKSVLAETGPVAPPLPLKTQPGRVTPPAPHGEPSGE